jgi:hypothetical protein
LGAGAADAGAADDCRAAVMLSLNLALFFILALDELTKNPGSGFSLKVDMKCDPKLGLKSASALFQSIVILKNQGNDLCATLIMV